MTAENPPVVTGAPPELQVDAVRVVNVIKQRLLEEISKAVMLEAALAESQERERSLTAQLADLQAAAAPGG
jgi:hypothetical protein